MASVSDSKILARAAQQKSSIHIDGKYQNTKKQYQAGFLETLKATWNFFTKKSPLSAPAEQFQVMRLTTQDLEQAPDQSLWRLGHSSILLKLANKFWLLDPVFSQRASPFSFIGPKRFHPVPIEIDALPNLEAVILSHDHYDHLDHNTVLAVQHKAKHFIAPLGVGDRLIEWGIPAEKIQQLDWWDEIRVGDLQLIATPAQHFSGRGLTDRNRTLWVSWVIISPESRVFFSGDTGYFDGFKTIGEKFGPFDLTLLENGAYNEAWADIHMLPEHTAQAHIDLRGHQLVPIHNGTFDLALHPWTEPFERITAIAKAKNITISTPHIGERLDILHAAGGSKWWEQVQDKL